MKILLILILFLIPFSSYAQSCHSLKTVDWMLGSWEYKNKEQTIIESWKKVSTMTLEGVGETYVNDQLKSSESLRVVEMSKALFYVAKVSHNALPVAFTLIKCSDKNAVFENLTHDFPKRIEYKSIDTDRMTVTVSDSKEKGFTISFVRTDLR